MQIMIGVQGERDAGRGWYIQLKDNIETGYDMKTCPTEPALFVKILPKWLSFSTGININR